MFGDTTTPPGTGLITISAEKLKPSRILTRNGILDIVAVHGLCGDRKASWSDDSGNFWLQDYLPTTLAHTRVSTYGYELSEEGISAAEIDEKAKDLLDSFCNGNLADTDYPRTFVFIGHNLGGCIIKQALLKANADPIYSNIAKRTSLLIFFGTPQKADSQAGWENLAHNLIHATGQKYTEPLSQILTKTSHALKDVSDRYKKLARTYNTVSIHESIKLESFGKMVFERDASIMGIPNETVLIQETDHMTMCQNIDEKGKLFDILCDKLVTSQAPDSLHIECLLTLSFLSKPSSGSHASIKGYTEPTWLLVDENYKQFIHSKTGILQLSGCLGSGLTAISGFLPRFIADSIKSPDTTISGSIKEEQNSPVVISFSFDMMDYRTCCTSALFASLTSQMLGVDPGYFKHIRHIYNHILTSGWGLESLWVLFRSTVMGLRDRQVYCILDSINNCDQERDHFLDDFLKLAETEEARFKIVFTNVGEETNKYLHTSSIDIEKRAEKAKDLEKFVEHGISELVRQRPGFGSSSKYLDQKISSILATNPNFLLASLIFKYLHDDQGRSTPIRIQSMIAEIPSSLDQVYSRVFIPSELSLNWKFKALSWITHSFRPLRPDELSTALAIDYPEGVVSLGTNNRPEALIEDLRREFGSFLNLEKNGISLVHESARQFLLRWAKDWDYTSWDESDSKVEETEDVLYGHARIASICLDYLRNAEWQEQLADIGNSNLESLPSADGASSLFPYAARYWYIHYRLGTKSKKLKDNVRRFLEDEERRTLWAHAEWLEGDTRRLSARRDTSCPLNTAAELGLNDVLLGMIDDGSINAESSARLLVTAAKRGDLELIKDLEQRGFISTNSDPLKFAAEKGHLHIIEHLLPKYTGRDPDILGVSLGTALHAASQSGYEDVVEELLEHKADPDALRNGLKPLHQAAELGNVNICRRLLREGVDINAPTVDERGCTALHLATLSGQLSTIRELLDSGADIDSEDTLSARALHHAAASGLLEAVELLESRGAAINDTNDQGKTALHVAVEGSHPSSVQALLDADSDLNIKAQVVGTPLDIVARSGNLEITKMLLKYGAKVNPEEPDIYTPFLLAVSYGHTLIAELLREYASETDEPDDTDSDQNLKLALELAAENGSFGTVEFILGLLSEQNSDGGELYTKALLAATKRGNIRIVQTLMNAGASSIRDYVAFTTLHSAAEAGDVEVISALLEAGLNLDDDPTDGTSPLYAAVGSGSLRAVKLLLSANADIDTPDPSSGKTALLNAAGLGHSEIVDVLIKAGARVTDTDEQGSSFLHCAAKGGNSKIVDIALSIGGDLLKADKNGAIPLHHAIENIMPAAVKSFLEESNAAEQVKTRITKKDRTPLHLGSKSGNTNIVELLLKFDEDINAVDDKKYTALHLASKKGHLEITKLLLDAGADPNLTNEPGFTPLYISFQKGYSEISQLLLHKTENVKTADGFGSTLLHLAAKRGMVPEVQELISMGLDVEAYDSSRCTPLWFAASSGLFETAKVLLEAGANPNYLDSNSWTVLSQAISSGNNETVMLLLENGAEPELEGTTWPALYTASCYRNAELVRHFVGLGVNLERRGGSSEWSPLQIGYDSAAVTAILLDAGARTDIVDDNGRSPIDIAVDWRYPETVEVYLKKGLDPLKRGVNGVAPIHRAAENSWGPALKSLELIIEYAKADDFDVRDDEGRTPLHYAVMNNREEAIALLLSTSKCDLHQKYSKDQSLLALAVELGHWDSMKVLVDKGAEIEPALCPGLLKEALSQENESIVELVLEKDASAAGKALEDAVDGDSLRTVELLTEKVAVIKSEIGEKLLARAVRDGSNSLIDSLIGKHRENINVNALDEHGWSLAMQARAQGHTYVAQKLEEVQENQALATKISEPSELSPPSEDFKFELDDTKLIISSTSFEAGQDSFFTTLANHPVPLQSKSFYFEMEVLDQGQLGILAIGVCTEGARRTGLPGWPMFSWAYHGDDGRVYHQSVYDIYAEKTYGKGDFVGCLYDLENEELSFTHNGTLLGVASKNVSGRLFPTIGLGLGAKVRVNFDKGGFKYKERRGRK